MDSRMDGDCLESAFMVVFVLVQEGRRTSANVRFYTHLILAYRSPTPTHPHAHTISQNLFRVIRHHELYVPRQRTRELVSDRHSTRERLPEGAYDDHDSPSFDDRRRRSGDQFDDSADSPPPPPPRTPPRRSIDEEALDYSE